MFDPRIDVKGLFTNDRVTGTDKYSNTAHVDIYLREENPIGAVKREGIIIMEAPYAVCNDVTIGNDYKLDEVQFDATLYVIRKKNISDYPTFINSIVDTFQTTLKTNRHSLSSCNDAIVTNLVSPGVPPKAQNMEYKRVMTVTSWKIS